MPERKSTRKTDLMRRESTPATPSGQKSRKKRKGADYSKVIKILYVSAIVLALATLAVVGVKTWQDLSAERSAQKLLTAYKEMATAAPTADPTAAPEVPPTPSPTPAPAPDYDEEAAVHELEDGSAEGVDESADYVQPDAPSVSEAEQIIQKIVKAVGDDGVIGTLEIPSTEQEYPIIGKWSYDLLKISICRYQGPGVNEPGNLVVIGHNYKSGAHFGNLKKLAKGDEIFLTGVDGKRVRYEIYEIETVLPDKFSALEEYKGEMGLTLMTCQSNGNYRMIVRCVQKDAPATAAATAGTGNS